MSLSPQRAARPLSDEERSVARRVAERLRVELEQLVETLPEHLRGGAAMSRALGVDRSTCQRVANAVRATSRPMEVLVKAPGVAGLRRFADALGERGTRPALLRRAGEAFDAFEALIESQAGSQAALARRLQAADARVSDSLDAAAQGALRARAFEALSSLTGRALDLQSNVILMRPVPGDPGRAETVGARYMRGLRGRAGAPPVSGLFFSRADDELPSGQPRPVPLEGAADGGVEPGSTLLPEFCSRDLPPVSTRLVGDVTLELIDPPGSDAPPIDVALGYRYEPPILHPALQHDRRLELYYHCVVPTRRVLLYAWLHRSMAARCVADAYVHQRSVEAMANAPDPWFDRLDQPLVVEILGGELAAAAHEANPRMVGFLAHLFETVGWSPSEFVGFRLAIDFPIWSTRTTMAFEFLEPAAAPSRGGPEAQPD